MRLFAQNLMKNYKDIVSYEVTRLPIQQLINDYARYIWSG
jgi:hypothetical protein